MEGETDGLPDLKSARKFNKQAASLIATHKAKGKFMALRNKGTTSGSGVDPHSLARALEKSANARSSAPAPAPTPLHDDDTHIKSGPSGSRRGGAQGVLGSLLRLYDRTPQSAASSSATLVQSEDGTGSSNAPQTTQPRTGSRTPPWPNPFGDLQIKGQLQEVSNKLKETSGKVASASSKASKAIGIDPQGWERPEAARSGAGVFGALQAGALDLAAFASPIASTVKPATTRPGYRLK